jgi:hypothetical protein
LPAATGQKDVFLQDNKSLFINSDRVNSKNDTVLGTLAFVGSGNKTLKIKTTNDTNGDIPKKRDTKPFSVVVNVNHADATQIEVNNKVSLSKYLDPGAIVSKKVLTPSVNPTTTTITIKFKLPNKSQTKKYGLLQDVRKNTFLNFEGSTPKVTFAVNLTQEIKKGDTLYFRDKKYSDNIDKREALKIGSKYIKNDDLILVVNDTESKYFLYKVTSQANEAFTIPNGSAKTYTITFTKQVLSNGEVYGIDSKTIYSYTSAPTPLLSKLSPTKILGLQSRFTFKLAPQYAITE